MKKSSRKLLLFSVLIFIVGLVATAVGMTALGWDFYKLDTHVYTEKFVDTNDSTFTDAAGEDGKIDIKRIEADINSWSVKVMSGDEFSFKYYVTEDTKTENITFNDGTLKIEIKEKWYANINIDTFGKSQRWKLKFELTIPENTDIELAFSNTDVRIENASFGDFKIKGANSDQVYKNTRFSNFTSSCNNASVKMTDCTAESLDFQGSNNNITIKSTEIDTLSHNVANSDIEMISVAISGKTELRGANMDVTLTDSQFANVEVNSANCDLYFKRVVMSALTTTGANLDIETSGYIDCGVFDFKSANADIELIILGSKEDIGYVKCTSANSTVRMNGTKTKDYFVGEGTIKIDVKGANIGLDISFTQHK